MEREEGRLEQELANLPERTVVRLPANYELVYRNAIVQLYEHLVTRDAAPSRNALHTLIETVVVHGGDGRGGKVRKLALRKCSRSGAAFALNDNAALRGAAFVSGQFDGVGCGSRI